MHESLPCIGRNSSSLPSTVGPVRWPPWCHSGRPIASLLTLPPSPTTTLRTASVRRWSAATWWASAAGGATGPRPTYRCRPSAGRASRAAALGRCKLRRKIQFHCLREQKGSKQLARGQDYKEKHKTRLKTNVKRTVLNNTKLRHFWAQIVNWAPIHARKTFIILAPGRCKLRRTKVIIKSGSMFNRLIYIIQLHYVRCTKRTLFAQTTCGIFTHWKIESWK